MGDVTFVQIGAPDYGQHLIYAPIWFK